jgi:hypothetical protein
MILCTMIPANKICLMMTLLRWWFLHLVRACIGIFLVMQYNYLETVLKIRASIYTRALRGRPARKLRNKPQMHHLWESSFALVRGFMQHLLQVHGQTEAFPSLVQVLHQVTSMCHLHHTLLSAKLLDLLIKASSTTMFLILWTLMSGWMHS